MGSTYEEVGVALEYGSGQKIMHTQMRVSLKSKVYGKFWKPSASCGS